MKIRKRSLAAAAGCGAKCLQIGGERFEHPRFHGEKRKLPFSAYVDQSAGLEFLNVVGQGGGRDGEGFASHTAAQGTTGPRDLLKQFEAFRISQGLEDRGALSP